MPFVKTPSPWLIGGPARCGKSIVTQMLAEVGGQVAALRVDALLHVYRDGGALSNMQDKQDFLAAYLERPRYMNPERTEIRRPIDDFLLTGEETLKNITIPAGNTDPIDLIALSLDEMASQKKKPAWLALDLHSELHFLYYKKHIPALKLLVVLREPAEAIAASLYWRTFPERRADSDRYFSYALFLWRLSILVTAALKRDFSDDIYVIWSNALLCGEANLPDQLIDTKIDLRKKMSSIFNGQPYFSFDKERQQFLCPDGTWRALLGSNELATIEQYENFSEGGEADTGKRNRGKFDIADVLLRVAGKNPVFAKKLADWLFFPNQIPGRILEILKAVLRKILLR